MLVFGVWQAWWPVPSGKRKYIRFITNERLQLEAKDLLLMQGFLDRYF